MTNLQNEIRGLSRDEKFELLDMLWESLESETSSLVDEQRVVLNSRMERYQKDPSNVIAWEQVRSGLFKKQ